MQIAIITVQRTPMYLYDTIDSLVASLPYEPLEGSQWIEVFVGTPHYGDIAKRLYTYARTHRIPDDIWELIEPLPPKLRAVGNFVAALRSGDGDLMLFEDDIAIKPGWLGEIRAITSGDVVWSESPIGFDPDGAFVSLYSHRAIDRASGACGELLRKPIVDFYGTLGLFVPAKHRRPLMEAALIHLQPDDPRPPEHRWPFDEIVKVYVNDTPGASLAVTIPSYVDHVGEVSVINPTHGPRRAPMF